MTRGVLTKLLLSTIAFLSISTIWAQENPFLDEYVQNPLTPGYGISDYFELSPGEIGNRADRPLLPHANREELAVTVKSVGRGWLICLSDSRPLTSPQLRILDMAGRTVYRTGGRENGAAVTFRIDPKEMPAGGVYVAVVGVGQQTVRVRIPILR